MTEQIALFIIAVRNSICENLRERIVGNNDNESFVSLYARFILIFANSNLSGIALFFTVDLFNDGRCNGE